MLRALQIYLFCPCWMTLRVKDHTTGRPTVCLFLWVPTQIFYIAPQIMSLQPQPETQLNFSWGGVLQGLISILKP
jgi:hypothetical protein